MLRYKATGFHSYTIYKGQAKGESQGAVSEIKASIQRRNRDEEAREQSGVLVFGFNWTTRRIRSTKRTGKDDKSEVLTRIYRAEMQGAHSLSSSARTYAGEYT